MKNRIPAREEIRIEDTWALEDIFANDDLWKAAYDKAYEYVPVLEKMAGTLGNSGEALLAYMQLTDQVMAEIRSIRSYASMKYDQDIRSSYYQDLSNQCMRLMVDLNKADSFATPEIMEIEDAVLERFYQEVPALELYRTKLNRIRSQKEHTLTKAEEKILAAAGQLAQTPNTVGAILRNADWHFPDVEDAEGNKYPLTQEAAISLMQSPDQSFRKKVFDTFYGTISQYTNTCAAILEGQVKQLKFFADMRKYGSAMEASLAKTEVPTAVYRNLVKTVNENLEPLHRYMALRKKIMGVDELHMYDLYTTIVKDAATEYTIEDSKKIVLEGLQPLGAEYCRVLKEGFDNRWIDVYENVGKRAGAYCNGAEPHPYVLLNHKDNLDSMFTLAHEMGHAMHSYLSNHTQPQCYKNYVIFVAEVASTCNEVLLMYHMLGKTQDKKERAYLINHFLDQFRSTF